MKKLALNLDRLTVDSFDTAAVKAAPRGTVAANEITNGAPTCAYHCTWIGQTCQDTTCGGGTEEPIRTYPC